MKRKGFISYLDQLESEAIYIIREVVAQSNNPVMLFSIGKDSSVLLHLAKKAFYPAPVPFPLLHVDTTWKFQDMYKLRDRLLTDPNINLHIYKNPDAERQMINPFKHSEIHTDIWKTEGLKQALNKWEFDVAIGGARRDEEKSRAKERVFSFRNAHHRWDPKSQRPELWSLYNARKTRGENIRVFPLSNWTELDVWTYISREEIEVVPLYFSAVRPTVKRNGLILMVDDDRFVFREGEKPIKRSIRFRSLGCYPLTAAIESSAKDVDEIIHEMRESNTSERSGRVIDRDSSNSMELKKQQGYF
ncbi:sulfate adenylyltransferase, small subunit [SAR116 cluster alpha proteobacterium HIMB100]|nr:sulfate adenylyltransferase, small subunit [SAR116 cluster alpha proteobacterium HIMB100]